MPPHTRRPLPPSLYADTAILAPETPALEGEARADVCVIGGGFTGLSAALHLAEAGASVIVLEAQEPGWGASGRNGGQVNPGLKNDPDVVERDFGPDLGGRMLALSYGAPDALFALVRRHQIPCEARQEGTLRAAIGARAAAEVRHSAEQGARRGWPVTFLDAAGTAALTGTARYTAAMLDARGGDVQPLSYARGLARAAMGQGARVHGGSPAVKLARAGEGWRVETPHGAVRAAQVVLATNGYTDDLWPGLRRSVVPAYSSILATAPLPEEVARGIMPRRAALYEAGRITTYYRMDRQNRLVIGGRGPQRPLPGPDSIRYLAEYARKLWPVLGGVEWTHGWNGQIAITADYYPHLHEPAPGLIAALGYNGRGVAMATAMGAQIARRLAGQEVDMPITAITPVPFHGFWKLGVAAKVWQGRVLDRLGL
ncbi:NAD(P)/FAD-dependent oxidoreductase [Roseococcus suduntuyensis]|uniref:Glycine/D-amino acid oxidase-like deaminating enzyme n=1 Tax=Roseococcus suduntuyensis TaxID=455361 RepID=A0A840AE52_9PROT|nr:FAD-binding oxidoreductase [Roseococcus suduntuyensis]MBB3900188.1 glycine/D-amino acid oxidase-like deaminating enzyme [Roseococcus suduntuyensis]